jgi:putative hydrolase of the HAD superfamily
MIDAGGFGVFVPHDLKWDFEEAQPPHDHPRYAEIPDLGALSEHLRQVT